MTSNGVRARLLLHAFSSFTLGGAQARFVQLANAFGDRYRHVIVAMDNQWQAGDRLAAGVPWEPCKLTVVRGRGLANRGLFRHSLSALRPDLVLSYNWGATEWLAANWPRVAPHVHVEDGFGPDETLHQLPRRVWMRRLLLRPRHVQLVVPSRRLLHAAAQWWMPPARTHYIPNGVAVPAQPVRVRSADGPLTIGTVSGLRPEKNIGRLVRAFATLRKRRAARLLIIGDGSERAQLESACQSMGIAADVEFAGYLSNPLQRLGEMDLFALSSDTEQQPISLLEAMAAGVPVISTAVGDVPHMVPPSASSLVLSSADDASFSHQLQLMVSRRSEWAQVAADCRAHVLAGYTEAAMLDRWRDVFNGRQGSL